MKGVIRMNWKGGPPRLFCGAAVLLVFLAGALSAQQISGSITGVVKDTQDAVITGARVTLVD